MPDDLRVEVVVEHQRAGFGAANERLSVESEPVISGEHREHLGGEVGTGQSAQVNPGHTADCPRIVDRPGRARVADGHLPLLAVVSDLEGGRARRGEPRDGDAERREGRHERAPIGFGAAGDDARTSAQQPQSPGGVVRRAPDPGDAPVDRVAREISDYCNAAHRRPTVDPLEPPLAERRDDEPKR